MPPSQTAGKLRGEDERRLVRLNFHQIENVCSSDVTTWHGIEMLKNRINKKMHV